MVIIEIFRHSYPPIFVSFDHSTVITLYKVAQGSKVVKEQVGKKVRYIYVTVHYRVSYIK